jgi:hypothetical protein
MAGAEGGGGGGVCRAQLVPQLGLRTSTGTPGRAVRPGRHRVVQRSLRSQPCRGAPGAQRAQQLHQHPLLLPPHRRLGAEPGGLVQRGGQLCWRQRVELALQPPQHLRVRPAGALALGGRPSGWAAGPGRGGPARGRYRRGAAEMLLAPASSGGARRPSCASPGSCGPGRGSPPCGKGFTAADACSPAAAAVHLHAHRPDHCAAAAAGGVARAAQPARHWDR